MTITEFPQQLQQIQQQYNREVTEARQAQNEDLTAEGLQNYRNQLVDQVRAQYLPKLAALDAQVRDEVEILTKAADRAIPETQGSTGDAWKRVEMLLDAGKALPDIIAAADPSQLLAIHEWAPTWLAANQHKAKGANLGSSSEAAFENSVRDRWAQILPKGEDIREALEAKPIAASLSYTIEHLRGELEGKPAARNTLAAAYGATQAAEEAAERLQLKAEVAPSLSDATA